MSRLRRASEQRSFFNPWSSEIPAPGSVFASTAGQRVDEETSLQLIDAYACISLLEDSVSQLPISNFRKDDTTRMPIDPPALLVDPDPEIELWEWVARMVGSMATAGNVYGYLHERDRRGFPTRCKILSPRSVQPRRNREKGTLEYA